jgi:hypothetical protein
MPKRRWSKRHVVSNGFVVIQRFFRFEGAGGAKWSMSALACAIPTMKTSMAARGKAVSSAVRSGHHEITRGMRKTRSIGQDIERWWKVNAVQNPGTKDALYRAFLDSLVITEEFFPFDTVFFFFDLFWFCVGVVPDLDQPFGGFMVCKHVQFY